MFPTSTAKKMTRNCYSVNRAIRLFLQQASGYYQIVPWIYWLQAPFEKIARYKDEK